MSLFVVFLSSQGLLDLPKVDDLASFFRSRPQCFFNTFLEFLGLLLVASPCFFFNPNGLGLELLHLLIPVLVEFVKFLKMSLLDLPLFAHVLRPHLVLCLALKLLPKLYKLLLREIGLNVLAVLLTELLMVVEDGSEWLLQYIYPSRSPLKSSGSLLAARLFSFPNMLFKF